MNTWGQSIIDSLPNPIFIKNKAHEFVSFNQAFADLLNASPDELYGKTDYDFLPKEQSDVFWRKDAEVMENGITNWNEEELTSSRGIKKTLLTSKTRIKNEANEHFILGAIVDITNNKNQEALIRNKKAEIERQKESIQTLLMEVHHRVKNNLQIIISLLNLQFKDYNDPKFEVVIDNIKNRIYSMAKIHEILCESDSLTEINFKEYIATLLLNLNKTFAPNKKVNIIQAVPDTFLSVEKSIALGMILNEIFTNSFRHAQPEGDTLTITFSMKRVNDHFILEAFDNGIPLEKGSITNSLGVELINIFSDQIEAVTLNRDNEKPFHYTFSIPVD